MQLNNIDIDMEKRKIILRNFQSGLPYSKAKENIEKRFGNCIGYGVRTCERWYRKFKHADFDLTTKPRDKQKKDYSYSKKKYKKTPKTVKVNEIKFNQQDLPLPVAGRGAGTRAAATKMNDQTNTNVQKLMKSKPELTIKKVPAKKLPIASPPSRPMPNLTPAYSLRETNKVPDEMPKLRPRRPRSKGIEIQIPVNSAKRMSAQTLTESHSIGVGTKRTSMIETPRSNRTASREVTVQFQNLNPDVAKNTVRKNTKSTLSKRQSSVYLKPQNTMLKITNVAHIESMSPQKSKNSEQAVTPTALNKRDSLSHPQTSPLNNQKGIIYLNPQEIFRKRFGGFENAPKRPSPYPKPPAQQTQHISSTPPAVQQKLTSLPPASAPAPPPVEKTDSLILFDSDDSGEDVLFPENISLPAPKTKADPTYTTYFDMESCQPMNREERVLSQTAIPVIEID